MLFEFCRCPKCKEKFLPDFDLTMDSYIDNDLKDFGRVVVDMQESPVKPDYMIFKCQSLGCEYVASMKDQEILDMIKDAWAKMAWFKVKEYNKGSFEFEQHFTQYLLDKDLGKFLSKRDAEKNPLIRDYLKLVRDGKAESIKKGDD